jgi:hypothetical protein
MKAPSKAKKKMTPDMKCHPFLWQKQQHVVSIDARIFRSHPWSAAAVTQGT